MNRENLTNALLEVPAKIQAQEINLLNLVETQLELNRACDDIEAPCKAEIAMNMSFKNEGQRKTALEIQLKENQKYQELKLKKLDIDLAAKKAQIELEFQRNVLRSYLAIAGMLNGTEAQT